MSSSVRNDRENMPYDVVIVGAGPAGLSCAIQIKKLDPELSVCIVEKGSEVGAHLLSGAVFETESLSNLIPDWKEKQAPISTEAKDDHFLFLTKKKSFHLPTPPQMKNHGNYIISLGELARWMAKEAESLGVEIFPGFAAAEILFNDEGQVIGIATGDMGIGKDNEKTPQFEPGVEIHAQYTVLAEGCHGSLSKQIIQKYDLRKNSAPQTYGLGIKEVWEIDPKFHSKGTITHTIGWPLDHKTYGGSWLYHLDDNQVSLGFVVGLDYQNTYLSPFEEMQRFKLHPDIKKILEGGRRVSYGARTLVEGGLQSLPKLTFPGGLLIGDAAGFLNVAKIKGNHNAIRSGMLAAESIVETRNSGAASECINYSEKFKKSIIYRELYKVRNIRPGFKWGLWAGLINAAFQTIGGWRLPLTFSHHPDHESLKKLNNCNKIAYPKPDNKFTFDRLSSVRLSNTMHEENQPPHLKLKDPLIPVNQNLPEYEEPAQRYCPAAVYEIIEDESGPKFVINAQNCVHCKTCDIKDPAQNIEWTVPEGSGGPNYSNM